MGWAGIPTSDHTSALYFDGAILHGSVAGLAEWTMGMYRSPTSLSRDALLSRRKEAS
jgi:hypothetical protein